MNKGKIAVLAVSMLFLGGYSANAAVINVSPDANPGDTNLQDAIDAAHNGDVLALAASVYTEEITIDGFKRLTLRGAGKNTTVIDGTGGSGDAVTISNSTWVTLSNLAVTSGVDDNILVDTCKHVKFLSIVSDSAASDGAELRKTAGTVVRNSNFTNNGSYGLNYFESNYEFKIINNVFDSNPNGGAYLNEATHGLVSQNQLIRNGNNGLTFYYGNSVKILFNTASNNTGNGLFIDCSAHYDVLVKGNTTNSNGSDGIYGSEGVLIVNNTAAGNGNNGIEAGTGCLVKNNIVSDNANSGINTYNYNTSAIHNLVTSNHGSFGIYTNGHGGMAMGNKVLNNDGNGLSNGGDVFLITRNFSDSNGGEGISPWFNSVLTKNNRSTNNGSEGFYDEDYGCTMNNNLAMNNTRHGIETYFQDVYFRNRSIGNGGDGFYIEGRFNFIRNNTVLNNAHHGIDTNFETDNLIRANTVKGNGDGTTYFDLYEWTGAQTNFYEHNRYDTKNFPITY